VARAGKKNDKKALSMSHKPYSITIDEKVAPIHVAGYRGRMLVRYRTPTLVEGLRAFIADGWPMEKAVARADDREVHQISFGKGEGFYVKRYQVKGFKLFLRTLLCVNKAQKAWRIGRKMRLKGIATPLPMALLKKRHSLFWTEYVCITKGLFDAVALSEAVARVQGRQQYQRERRRRLIADGAEYLADLHIHKIYHSDFTADNILVRESEDGQRFEIFLIDLDAVRTIFRISDRRRDKNLERMGRNFLDLRMISTADRARFLKYYLGYYSCEKRSLRKLFRDILKRTEQRLEDRGLSFIR